MKILALSEGSFTVDATKQFVPYIHQFDELSKKPSGSLLVEIQPFVIITSHDVILLDTGLGFKEKDGALQLHHNLLNAGIGALEVTKVLLSHLHKDHSGGIFNFHEKLNQNLLSFPNATYYINKQELDFAISKGTPSFDATHFGELKNSSAVHFTDNIGTIDDYIHYEVCGGHSPFHQVFKIIEDGEIVFYGGDVAPQLMQMKTSIITKYDFDGKKSMQLRKQWWNQGQQEKWTFLFYHDIKSPMFKFE